MATAIADMPFRFMDLPVELRNMIYDYAVSNDECPNPQLAGVSSHMRREYLPVYFLHKRLELHIGVITEHRALELEISGRASKLDAVRASRHPILEFNGFDLRDERHDSWWQIFAINGTTYNDAPTGGTWDYLKTFDIGILIHKCSTAFIDRVRVQLLPSPGKAVFSFLTEGPGRLVESCPGYAYLKTTEEHLVKVAELWAIKHGSLRYSEALVLELAEHILHGMEWTAKHNDFDSWNWEEHVVPI